MTPNRRPSGDPIDWVDNAWDRHDYGDPTHFLAMGSLMRVHQLMATAIDRTLKRHDLSRSAYLLLVTLLLSEDGSRSLSRLSRHLLVHPTTVTLLVDQLETDGLVRRVPHPTDRRTTLAALTDTGRAAARAATDSLAGTRFGLGGVNRRQARELIELLRPIRHAAGDDGATRPDMPG